MGDSLRYKDWFEKAAHDLRGAEMNYTQFGTAFMDNAKLDK